MSRVVPTPLSSVLASEADERPRVVYCEANFGALDGKTANGLVRHSERYEIVSVIDSVQVRPRRRRARSATKPNGIPICADLADAIALAGARRPTSSSSGWRRRAACSPRTSARVVLDAIGRGMNIVNGLHEFLNDDPEFAAASAAHGVDDPRRAASRATRRTCACSAAASTRSPAPGSPCSAPTARSASAPPRPS